MPVNRERLLVPKQNSTLRLEYRTLEQILEEVKECIEHYGKDAYISKHSYDYEETEYYFIMTKEPETDEQMQKRIAREEAWERSSNEQDAADYKRLQEKFGNTKT